MFGPRMDNPLDRFGLSPFATVEEITSAMRERAEEAPEEERAALRDAWEELTTHPRKRLRAALFTAPPELGPLNAPPSPVRPPALSPELVKAQAPVDPGAPLAGVALVDLVPRPLVAAAFALTRATGRDGRSKAPSAETGPPRVLPRFAEDPLVALVSQPRGAKRT